MANTFFRGGGKRTTHHTFSEWRIKEMPTSTQTVTTPTITSQQPGAVVTVKSKSLEYLNKLLEIRQKYSKRIEEISGDQYLSETGKQHNYEQIAAKAVAELSGYATVLTNEINKVLDRIDKEEDDEQAYKQSNLEYAALLAHVIQVLPTAISGGDLTAVKQRLAHFKNDPFAISAIKSMVNTINVEKLKKMGVKGIELGLGSIIPEDTRGVRQERLLQLVRTLETYTENLGKTLSIPGGRFATDIDGQIKSTIQYVETCNDECTDYQTPGVITSESQKKRANLVGAEK